MMTRLMTSMALALASVSIFAVQPAAAQLSINISVNFAPPALPIYDQPPIPAPDYIWVPGYWAWDEDWQDYYWVPGTWVMAPRPGLLWTPPWWGWQDGVYLFHAGYWAPHVGFYGGVVYGFGYTGSGFQGAYWSGGHVSYNRSVTNVRNVNITNVYNKTVIVNRVTNVSYNGGPGGVTARPSAADQAAMREPHVAPPSAQQQHIQAARANRQLFAKANQGRPPIAAAARPAQLSGPGVMPTRQAAPYHPSAMNGPAHPPSGGSGMPLHPATAPGEHRQSPNAPQGLPSPNADRLAPIDRPTQEAGPAAGANELEHAQDAKRPRPADPSTDMTRPKSAIDAPAAAPDRALLFSPPPAVHHAPQLQPHSSAPPPPSRPHTAPPHAAPSPSRPHPAPPKAAPHPAPRKEESKHGG